MCFFSGFFHPGGEVVQGLQVGFSQWFNTKSRVLPGVEHEWGGVHRSVDPIIVGELGYRQPFVPIILALIYGESQELLDFLIDPLCLTIGLWVVSGGCCDPDFQQLAEAAHEIQHKLGPSVANDLLREPMEFPNMVSEQPSYAQGSNI